MTWIVSLMTTWTSAGGRPTHDLGPVYPGTVIRTELSARGEATLILDAAIAFDLARYRAIVRIDTPDTFYEFRIMSRSRPTRGVEGTRVTVGGRPRIYDLTDADLVREKIGGRTITRFDENLNFAQYAERHIFVNKVQDGLLGLSLGISEFPDPYPLTWDRWTRGELLQASVAATKGEPSLRRLEDDSEVLDLLKFTGDAAPIYPLRYGDLLEDHRSAEDYDNLFTVARIFGEQATSDGEAATIGENCWRVANVRALGVGDTAPFAVELRQLGGTGSPLLEDGQYAAHVELNLSARYLQRADGVTRAAIVGSTLSTSEVQINSGVPAIGERVQIVADADGNPLETLELPSAIAAYGYVVGDLAVAGGRGERQYAENGGHESGLDRWAPVNGGIGTELRRTELGATVAGAADGARAGGVGTGTALALKDFPPATWIRRGDALNVGGALCSLTADAVPNTSGALTLNITPGLPGNYPDNTPLSLVRREVRVLTLDGSQSPLAPYLSFTDSNTDNFRTVDLVTDNTLASAVGGYTSPRALPRYASASLLAGAAVLDLRNVVSALTWATIDDDVLPTTITSPGYAGTLIVGTGWTQITATVDAALISGFDVVVGTRFRVAGTIAVTGALAQSAAWWVYRVVSIAGNVVTLSPDLPSGVTAVGISGFTLTGGAYEWVYCNVLLANASSWMLTHARETRTLYTNGATTVGTTSVPFKPQAVIARRDWTTSDSVQLARALSATMDITSGTLTEELDHLGDPTGVWILNVVFDTGTSTLDSIDPADFAGGVAWFPIPGSWAFIGGGLATFNLPFSLVSVSGGTARLTRSGLAIATLGTLPHGTSAAWTVYDSYAITGAASWAATGRVALAIGAIPAGRTYSRGARAWANWHTQASFGDNTLLRLHATVTTGAMSVELWGADTWLSTSNPLGGFAQTVYRVYASGSTLPIAGNLLYAAASAQADGAGDVAVTITAANANAISDGEIVTITRPALLPSTIPATGSALRLFAAVGGSAGEPDSDTPGYAHELEDVRVPDASTRTITALADFSLSMFDWSAGNGPVLDIVDALGNVLSWAALGDDGLLVEVAPGVVRLVAQATVAISGRYGFRVYGGSSSDLTIWCVHLRTLFTVGNATDVPYTGESFASLMQLTAQRAFTEGARPRISDQLDVTELNAMYAAALGVPLAVLPKIVLGGRVHLEEWNRLERVVAYTIRPERGVSEIEIGQLAPDGARLIGGAANAVNLRGSR